MIVYLHGFNSSPDSSKARQFGAYLADLGRREEYYCPLLSNSPREAMTQVETELMHSGAGSITLVGSSLGGFYATYLAEKYGWKAVLVNPAVHANRLLRGAVGPQTNWYTHEQWVLTDAHIAFRAGDMGNIQRREFLYVGIGENPLFVRIPVGLGPYCPAQ